jgi:hypothetical protein
MITEKVVREIIEVVVADRARLTGFSYPADKLEEVIRLGTMQISPEALCTCLKEGLTKIEEPQREVQRRARYGVAC